MSLSIIKYPRPGNVRLIDETGQQIGVVSYKEALTMAQDRELELIEIAPQANPPVCKIMDYGKAKYEASKKEKPVKSIPRKEIRMSPNIADGDLMTKANRSIEFLNKGYEVLANVHMRGREKGNPEVALTLLQRFVGILTEKVGPLRMLREITNTGGGKIECLMAK